LDQSFTTRPELLCDHAVVSSTHWLATAAGLQIVEQGGNAADAAVAAGFALQVLEPHMCGPAGEVPIIVRPPGGDVEVICGQGVAPQAATIELFREMGLSLVPGTGLLPAAVPGAWGGWLLLLERHGSMTPGQVLAPAIALAEQGFPLSAEASAAITSSVRTFRRLWPSSARTWLDGAEAPLPGRRWRLPVLAATWRRLLDEAGSHGTRETQIDRLRRAWYEGFVAEEIAAFCRAGAPDPDGTHRFGLLTEHDLASWQATIESTISLRFRDWTVHKTQPWGQGLVQLLWLSLLDPGGIPADDLSAEWVHAVAETGKLAFADREAWFGDPAFAQIPVAELLSPDYTSLRASLITDAASLRLVPGAPGGRTPMLAFTEACSPDTSRSADGTGEPTAAYSGPPDGDTCHVDVADRTGLVISATPSGGWLQSSPVIPSLGFPLGGRLQMTWLQDGHPSSLRPGARPRTTLTPSLAVHDDGRVLGYGTPGGDQQDQWSVQFLLRHAVTGRNLQAAIDAPAFHIDHMPSSFWPRAAHPGRLVIEDRFGPAVIADLRRRGHDVQRAGGWSEGRLSAAQWEPRGWLRAAANPRGMNGYAGGR
jgi:gamma-glutamyltranspeptidase/glutathione hydrolase